MSSYKELKKRINEESEESGIARGTEHKNHAKAITRRDLVGQGLISGAAFVAVPTILELLNDYLGRSRAFGMSASECVLPSSSGFVAPAINVHLQGGWNVWGAAVGGKQAMGAPMEFLIPTGYTTVGWAAGADPSARAPDMTFGHPMHARAAFVNAIKAAMSKEARDKTQLTVLAGISQDDQGNDFNPLELMIKSVNQRAELVQLATATNNGQARTSADMADPSLSKALISNTAGLTQLVGGGEVGALFGDGPVGEPRSALERQAAEKVANAIAAMSGSRVAAFNAMGFNQQLKNLVECNYLLSPELLVKFTSASVDPTNDTKYNTPVVDPLTQVSTAIFNGGTTPQQITEALQMKIITKLCLDGNARGGNIEFSNFDYHNQGIPSNRLMDSFAANQIGSALEAAHRSGKPLFISVSTSGSVSCSGAGDADGQVASKADSGARGGWLCFAIGQTARPAVNHTMIGKLNDGGAVDASYGLQANSVVNAGKIIAANYVAFAKGNVDGFTKTMAKMGAANPIAGLEKDYVMFKRTT